MASAASAIGFEVASNVAGSLITPLFTIIDDVMKLDENHKVLRKDFKRLKNLLEDMIELFKDQKRTLPKTIEYWLQELRKILNKAKDLIRRSQKRCLWNFRLATEIKQWNAKFENVFKDLETDFSILQKALHISESRRRRGKIKYFSCSCFCGRL